MGRKGAIGGEKARMKTWLLGLQDSAITSTKSLLQPGDRPEIAEGGKRKCSLSRNGKLLMPGTPEKVVAPSAWLRFRTPTLIKKGGHAASKETTHREKIRTKKRKVSTRCSQ